MTVVVFNMAFHTSRINLNFIYKRDWIKIVPLKPINTAKDKQFSELSKYRRRTT